MEELLSNIQYWGGFPRDASNIINNYWGEGMKNIFLSVAGYYCIAFFLFHLAFWKIFRWKADLQRLSPVNRAIIQVLNLRLLYLLLCIGAALLLFQTDFIETGLGRFILITMSIFWFMRAVEQIVFFSRTNIISWILVVVFLIGSFLFIMPIF
jgi:hypothetical protein